MPQSQAIVWISNREARVFRFGNEALAQGKLKADAPLLALKHRKGEMQKGDLASDLAMMDRAIDALRGISTWRLIGTDGACEYLVGYLEKYKERDGHCARLLTQLSGVAEVATPTDAVLNEQARQPQAA
ncbi:MAG: hypothetical protein LCH95_14795 [Proteobacteria bacterium]|nr:hypothetical protein [Pseudomonadota bacterium]